MTKAGITIRVLRPNGEKMDRAVDIALNIPTEHFDKFLENIKELIRPWKKED